MIPRTLQIKNFLSYGTECPPISFDNHNLICLSGNNGHGKSALLDALTWAIWGCARKIQNSARADQGLLRLGQTMMMVIFDCTIHDATYRIKREFELVYGKPKITLDLALVHNDGTVSSLTEKTIRDTQARINSIIGLDYETFVNSSFLRQGNANEFSKRSPKERKEIISTILGLTLYDALKRSALEKSKHAAHEMATVQTLIAHTRTEQETLAAILATYPEFQESLRTTHEQLAQCTNSLNEIVATSQQQEQEKQKLTMLLHEYETQKTRYQQALHELRTLAHQWRMTRAQITDVQRYAIIQKQLQEARAAQETTRENFTKYLQLKETAQQQLQQKTQLQHAITTLETQIKAEQRLITERLGYTHKQVEEQIVALNAQDKTVIETTQQSTAKITDATRLITTLTAQSANADTVQKQFDKRKETYHRWTTLGNVIREEHATQLQRLQLTQDLTDPSCPLCEQSLSTARKRFLQTKIEVRIHIQAHQLERFKKLLPQLKAQLITEHTALQTAAEQKTTIRTLEQSRAQEEIAVQKLTATRTELTAKKQQLTLQEQEIAHQKKSLAALAVQEPSTPELITLRTTHEALNRTIAETHAMLVTLAYDPAKLALLDTQVKELQQALELYEKQAHAHQLQQDRAATITSLIFKLKQEKKALQGSHALQSAMQNCAQTLTELKKTIVTLTMQEQEHRLAHQKLLIEQGKYDAATTRSVTAATMIVDLEQRLKVSEELAADYQAIATAVGKDGIQALLIEEAIPEIEDYANTLLAKLTNNTAHIMIESLRDLKSGGTKETLDIKISDTQGIRPYEMFSGGEAFRIDIALRIAISKLLAHRAGTALQTLIIDEGFGSQDEDGLHAMIDVLHALHSEFAKIIVVSHLPMMKDQFPVHFVVEKGSQGSMVRILEQG